MEIKFNDKNLKKLHEEGKHKKYRLPKNVFLKYSMRIQQLEYAEDIYDLWKSASLNFERLEGYKNRYSVRIDKKWRLEFNIEFTDEKKIKGIVYIDKISKHYR